MSDEIIDREHDRGEEKGSAGGGGRPEIPGPEVGCEALHWPAVNDAGTLSPGEA